VGVEIRIYERKGHRQTSEYGDRNRPCEMEAGGYYLYPVPVCPGI
jgi:hypothetical protein